MTGYDFTEDVRFSLAAAREEAARLRHEHTAPAHMLLGMLRRRDGDVAALLRSLEVDIDTLVSTVEAMALHAEPPPYNGPKYDGGASQRMEFRSPLEAIRFLASR